MVVLAEASYVPEQPDDPLAWAAKEGPRAVLLAVEASEDLGLMIDLQAEREDLVVVALVRDASPDAFCQALSLGACSAAGWDATGEEVIALLAAGLQDRSIIPTPVARRLARQRSGGQPAVGLTEMQVEWLSRLASGVTVSALAARAGYSEREMYRLLAATYQVLGTENRSQALVKAARWGVLD
jgi:DNA-binding NarL/FixJ family response regulator